MITSLTAQEKQSIIESVPDLSTPCIDEAVNGYIALTALSNGITYRIPHFEGQKVGALIRAFIDSELDFLALEAPITSSDADTIIPISAVQALRLQGQKIHLFYFYDGYSLSDTSTYWAQGEINQPVVDEAENRIIPLAAVLSGVKLRLMASPLLANQALVSVYWHGSANEGSLIRHFRLEGHDHIKDVVLDIDSQYLKPNQHGVIQLVYTIENENVRRMSHPIELIVEGRLKAPEPVYFRPGLSMGDILQPTDEQGRIPISLNTDGLVAGDVLTFIFIGSQRGKTYILRQTLAPHQIGHDLIAKVPFRPDGFGAIAKLMTIVERGDDFFSSPLRIFNVN